MHTLARLTYITFVALITFALPAMAKENEIPSGTKINLRLNFGKMEAFSFNNSRLSAGAAAAFNQGRQVPIESKIGTANDTCGFLQIYGIGNRVMTSIELTVVGRSQRGNSLTAVAGNEHFDIACNNGLSIENLQGAFGKANVILPKRSADKKKVTYSEEIPAPSETVLPST
jgi:hypothetical protein